VYAKLISERLDFNFDSIFGCCANGKMPYLNCGTGYYPWD